MTTGRINQITIQIGSFQPPILTYSHQLNISERIPRHLATEQPSEKEVSARVFIKLLHTRSIQQLAITTVPSFLTRAPHVITHYRRGITAARSWKTRISKLLFSGFTPYLSGPTQSAIFLQFYPSYIYTFLTHRFSAKIFHSKIGGNFFSFSSITFCSCFDLVWFVAIYYSDSDMFGHSFFLDVESYC